MKQGAARQRGAQLVELAIMLPIVLTAAFSIVAFSLLFMVQHSLNSAVSQAARSVAVAGSVSSAETAARNLLDNALPSSISSAGFSFSSSLSSDLSECGNTLAAGSNPSLRCLRFSGEFNVQENPFLLSLPFARTLLPEQLSASTVVLYQNSNVI